MDNSAMPEGFSMDGVFIIIAYVGGKVCLLEVGEWCTGGA